MNSMIPRLLCILFFLTSPAWALDATLDGRITDSATAAGIEGATITLEPIVPGTALTAGTNPFGFYRKEAIPPAGYTLKVRHRAYLDHDEAFTPGSGAKVTRNIALTPRYPGVTTLDIFAQTFCTRTMMELGGVPIRVQRYLSEHAPVVDETFYLTTDMKGGATLRGVRPGWFTFRFNDSADGTPRPKWDALDQPQRRYLDTAHAAVAQLMPQGQTFNFRVIGLDARDPEAGPVPLDKVYVELTGVRYKLPQGFHFGVDDPEPYEVVALPVQTGETGPAGPPTAGNGSGRIRSGATVGFSDLPALGFPYRYKMKLKRFGYRDQTFYFSANAAGDLTPVNPDINLDFELATNIWVHVVNDEYSALNVLTGAKVRLQGIAGTATEGIDREAIPMLLPGNPDYPLGVHRAMFGAVLPGRYRVSVDSITVPLPKPALDGAFYEVRFRFRGSDTIDVNLAALTKHELKVTVEPATIRGRLFAADERATLTVGAAEIQDPFSAYRGPRYAPRVQTGITFSESAYAGQLAPGLKVVSFDTDAAGRFVAKVRPGYYGFKIPAMTDYWGSNFDWVNAASGEQFHVGWCYDVDPGVPPGLPSGPYHSAGVPVRSGDDITLDLFVRKQRYYVRGSIGGDTDNPLVGAWVMANPTELTIQSIPFSELVEGGGTVTLDATTQPLEPFSSFGFTGTRAQGSGAAYRFAPVGPGSHTLSFTQASHTFTPGVGAPSPRTFTLTDLLYPGGTVTAPDIPLDYLGNSALGNPWTSTYTGADTVKFNFYDNNDLYVGEKTYPEYFRVGDLGSRLFFKSGGALFKMRTGTWTLFVNSGTKWYSRTVVSTNTGTEHVFDIFTRTAADVPRPTQSYTLKVQAFADGDPTHFIGGATVSFDGLSAITSSSGTVNFPGRTEDYTPLAVTHPVWAWAGNANYDAAYAYVGGVPEITITVRLSRGMLVRGAVHVSSLPATDPDGLLPGVEVVVSNRFGSRLATLTTDAAGKFGETPVYALPFAEAGFIDINHPGHYPKRIRFETNDTGAPGSPVIIAETIPLTPFAAPPITMKVINRLGPFLPGVRKSGDAGTLGNDPDVLGTFAVSATANPVEITLPNYDLSSGASGGSSTITITDNIEEILLVDPRSYAVNPLQDVPTDEPPPATTDPKFYDAMRTYLRGVGGVPGSPAKPNMFVSRAVSYIPGLGAGELIGTGEVPLWKLPPGAFRPYAIVRTRNGAWNHGRIEFTGFDDYKNLYGLRLPPWAAGLADIIGTVSAAESLTPDVAKEQIKKIMPEGLMKALPKISGTIATDPDGFLIYTYSIGNELEDGMDLPGTGWLALLPGFEGFSVEGGAVLKLEGHDGGNQRGRISLNAGASGSLSLEPDVEDFIPKSIPKAARKELAKKVDAKFGIFGSVDVNGSTTFTPGGALEVLATLDTFGSITGNLEFDVTDFIEKIPHVGQVVTALNAIDENAVKATATLDLMTGVQHQLGFSTEFPRVVEFPAGGSIALPAGDDSYHPQRRSYLGTKFDPIGGKSDAWLQTNFYLYAAIGLGLDLFDGTAGAKGEIRLTGSERYFPRAPQPQPSMKITMNRYGDWPLIKRLEGSLNAYVKAYLDVWVTKLEKEWEWELITIDHQFNSAPFFDLVKIDIRTSSTTVAGGTPAIFTGLAPAPIRGLYALSQFATTSAAGDLLAFVDIAPGTGAMVLKVAKRSGALTWSAPVTVATSTGAMLRPQMVTLPGGAGAMLVWTEIAPGDTGDATPPSTLMFSTTVDGVTWSAPAMIATLAGVAADSRLFALSASKLGLVFLETDDGPGGETFDVKAVPFSGGAWGAVQTILTDTVLRGFDATGPGAAGTVPAQIVFVDSATALKAITWDGAAAGAPVTVTASGIAGPLALTSGPDNTFVLAHGFTTGAGLGLSKKVAPGPWAPLGTLTAVSPAQATLVATTVAGTTRYLAAWAGGAAPATLNYAWFDGAGTTLLGPSDLTGTAVGAYRSLRAVAHSGAHEATLFAQFDNGSGLLELRSFDVSLAAGSINHDRDTDTLDDRAELRIVDANLTDAIVTIDDVLAGADFDGDGASNAVELAMGTDPTNAASFPGQRVGAAVVVAECHEFGTVPGRVVVFREGNGGVPLTIHYSMGGTATNGTDYTALSGTLVLPTGVYSRELEIAPLGDALAEGSELATLTISADAAYSVSASSPSASVTINDLPMDEWRFAHFTAAELLDAGISGDLADPEFDQLRNLLEYAFDLGPKAPDATGITTVALLDPMTSLIHLGAVYVRRSDALDLTFTPQLTEDLVTWRTAGADVQTVSITSNGDGTETVVLRDVRPATLDPKRFLRVNVERLLGP